MIDRGTIDRIFAAADIVEVVGEFVSLRKKGINYSACCPFHSEKTPSFVVSPAKGLYKCFGCGKGGNAVNFVMEHEKLSYPDALKWLAKKYSIEIQEKELTDQQRQANDNRDSMMVLNSFAGEWFAGQLTSHAGEAIALGYMRERGFSDATIALFNIGYNPEGGDTFSRDALAKGYKEEFLVATGLTIIKDSGGYYDRFNARVMFPIHSMSGRIIGFGGRTMRSDKKTAKYLNSPESEVYHKGQTLYGLWQSKKGITRQDSCILVEGYMDVMQMHQAGIDNVVASSGTALTREQVLLIKRFTRNVVVIYDGDAAGIKASMRGIDMLLTEGMNVRAVLMPDGHDPDSFARSRTQSELEAFMESEQQDFVGFKTRLLLSDAGNDPIKRAALITDIIATIALVPEAVERAMFIRECSRLMEVSETLLTDEVLRHRMRKADGGKWHQSVQKPGQPALSIKPQQSELSDQEQDDMWADMDSDGPGQSIIESRKVSVAKIELLVLELELIGYMVNFATALFDIDATVVLHHDDTQAQTELSDGLPVAQTIISELERDNIEMLSPLHQSVVERIREALRDGLDPQQSLISSSDNQIVELITNLIFEEQKYSLSLLWQRNEVTSLTDRQRLSIAIPKALDTYKQKMVNMLVEQAIEELSAPGLEAPKQAELLNKINDLNELRRSICNQYERLN